MDRRLALLLPLPLLLGNGPDAGPPAPPAPPPSKAATVAARLGTADGPLPGAPALVVRTTPDPTYCGGVAVTVRATRARQTVEKELIAAMTIAPPRGLDFDPAPAHDKARKASMARFSAWIDTTTKAMTAARTLYEQRVFDQDAAAETRVEAAARLAQLERRFAEMIARMEIPKSLRTGSYAADTTAAFCDSLAEKAEPLLDQADQAAAACRKAADDAKLAPGWWSTVCAAP